MIGVILNHRYRIAELIGVGGMAQVYRAVNLTTRKNVAIKMLKPEFRDNTEFLRRFEREAKAVLHLSHDNIVRAYGVGQYDDMPYIILEYVEGRTLKEIIQERGAMPQKTAVSICKQVLDALSAAHAAGIIHRDVKPQNVIVTKSGKAKLTDFGIARDVQATTVTFAGSTVLGSAHYLSPEQAKGKAVTAASDIYSAGVMLYEMLTGDVPFTADTTVSVALRHINDEPLPPIELNPRISPALNECVLCALKKDPLERFGSARHMSRALDRALKDPYCHPAAKRDPAEPGAPDGGRDGGGLFAGPRLHGAWKIAIVVGVFICVLVGTFLAIRSAFNVQEGNASIIPALAGKTIAEAKQKAEDYGYTVEIGEYVVSSSVAYGLVTDQLPEAGQSAKPGSTITVSVSAGPEAPTVPDLLGKTYDEALAALTTAGLSVGALSYQVSDVSIGYVCSQTPIAGTELSPGDPVNICISATTMSFSDMPSLLSMSLRTAVATLESAGFERIFVRYDNKSNAEARTVVQQQPVAGESVEIGMAVTLTVAGSAAYPFVSDIAYNLNVPENGTLVTVTIEEAVGGVQVERILYENTLEKGEMVPVSFTATAESDGMYELILYINGVESRRQDTGFAAKE